MNLRWGTVWEEGGLDVEARSPRTSLAMFAGFQTTGHVCSCGQQTLLTHDRLDGILLEAVDYGLTVLGETVRQAIYKRLENHYELKRNEIPERLEVFHKALEGIFGASTRIVERLIARSLYQRLGLNFTPHPDWTLIEYVNQAESGSEPFQVHE